MEDPRGIHELLSAALRADDVDQAERLIVEVKAGAAADELFWPEVFEDLAQSYRRLARYDEAIDAMRRALDAGWAGRPDGRSEIAEFLLLAGRGEEAAALWDQVRADTPDDVWLYNHAGLAYGDLGDHESAARWLTQGLQLALETGDPERVVDQLLELRRRSRDVLGQGTDELDERAQRFLAEPRPTQSARDERRVFEGWDVTVPAGRREAGELQMAVCWFPAGDYERALELWPDLAQLWSGISHGDYCRRIQASMAGLATRGGPRYLACLSLHQYLPWCEREGLDPALAQTRAHYAAERLRRGEAPRWPPGRNERCWCGSQRKYKRCCGTVAEKALHPLYTEV